MFNDPLNQELADSFSDPIMIVDSDRRIAMVNEAFLAMQGLERSEAIGRPCFSVLHRETQPCRMPIGECPHASVFSTGKSLSINHRHYSKSNREIVCEIQATPVRDSTGSITAMLEVIRDVTEGSILREENRQNAEFLTSVLEGIGDGVVVVDPEFRIVLANSGYLNQTARKWNDVVGSHCYEVSHHFTSPCTDQDHVCPVRTVFNSGKPCSAMHVHYDDRGRKVYVECHAYPITDASGNVVRAIETIKDVTQRVVLEQKLKESESKYRDLYDNSPDGYYSLAGNGLIVEVNQTFLEMLGYRREEVVGKLFIEDLLADESIKICLEKFPEFKRSGKIKNVELTMLKKDGSSLPVMMSGTAVFDAEGSFLVSRSVMRDISERRQINEEKKKLQEQLFRAQKLEALGTLAGGIAHDFNNLLASILGYASLAQADLPEGSPVRSHVDIIETASLRASELTQQLLAFAKGGKYSPKANDINAVVREVTQLLSRTVDKNITIEARTSPNLWPGLCDGGQVQQAILNICINGCDAMPQGGELVITTRNTYIEIRDAQFFVDLAPGHYVQIVVADQGIGMDHETREHIFDPFFTTKSRGTGLGLSFSYGIMKKHHGGIQVYSEPGKGSEFTIYIPACITGESSMGKPEALNLRRGRETILVVDDEPMVMELAREILQRFGYTVHTAPAGAEAVRIYEQKPRIDLVILDMVMPGMSGRDVFKRLKEMDPAVKVIISSGYSHERDADDLLGAGAVGFVQKPYRVGDLIKAVGDILGAPA